MAAAASKWAARKTVDGAAGHSSAGAAADSAVSGEPVKPAAYSSFSTPLSQNLFAKYATLNDPRPLWRAAIRELGQQLAEVLAQGGLEADFEAPGLFAAADCLAQRARRFAEHQATQLLQRGVPVGAAPAAAAGALSAGGSSLPAGAAAGWPVWLASDPQVAGSEAEALIRDALTVAIDCGKAALTAAEQEQQVAAAFPSLSSAVTAGAAAAGTSPASPRPDSRHGGSSRHQQQQQQSSAAGVSASSGSGGGPAAAKTAGTTPPARQPPQQQQQQTVMVQGPPTPESSSAAAVERESSRAELFFDHAFSEEEEEEEVDNEAQQQQQQSGGTPQPGDSTTAASGGAATTSNARAIPRGAAGGVEGAGDDAESLSGGAAPAGGSSGTTAMFGTSPGTSGLLGSSPTTSAMNNANLSGDFFMYQAADGQWLFLHPLNLRCLLHAFGSYAACPPTVTGKVLELEDIVQDEGSR